MSTAPANLVPNHVAQNQDSVWIVKSGLAQNLKVGFVLTNRAELLWML
jgi:hypothetical protein